MSQNSEELPQLPEHFYDRWESVLDPEDLFANIQADKNEITRMISEASIRVNNLIAWADGSRRGHNSVYLKVYDLREEDEEDREDQTIPVDKEVQWDRNLRVLENLYQKLNIGPNEYKTIEWESDPDAEIKYCYEIVRFCPEENIAFLEFYGFFDTQHMITADYSDPPDDFEVEVITLQKGQLPRNLQRRLD
jgi:hypothetical protein